MVQRVKRFAYLSGSALALALVLGLVPLVTTSWRVDLHHYLAYVGIILLAEAIMMLMVDGHELRGPHGAAEHSLADSYTDLDPEGQLA